MKRIQQDKELINSDRIYLENILNSEKSFEVVKDGALLEIFSKEVFLVHNLKSVLEFQPVDALSDEFTKTKLASKAVAFDHLTYLLLTQNRWLSL